MFKIRDETYNIIKNFFMKFQYVIVFFASIFEIWNVQNGDKIVLTLTAVNALICGYLEITTNSYKRR